MSMSANEHSEHRARVRRTVMNAVLIFLIGVLVARLPATLAQITGKAEFLETVDDVYKAIMTGYVDVPDATKVQNGAISGMLEALNDDYAEYIPEEDAANFEKEMTGHFSGIGCQIEMRDGWLTVVTPLEDTPAFNAGIMAGDRIVKIGDKSTFGLSADECIKLLTGEAGTPVTFTVQRNGTETPYTLTRATITSKSVRGISRINDGSGRWNYIIDPAKRIAYIRLSQFTPTAANELAEAIQAADEQAGGTGDGKAIGGLIFDLRNNPGGVMEGALQIADMFLDGGVIMSIRGRTSPPVEFTAEAEGTLPDFPLVVMVNENSASASEIVSGSLSDHKRAIIVGTRSFGKGLVQTVVHLPHAPKAQVKFTTQRYYLPSGRLIQRTDDSADWGVDPSPGFYVPMSDSEQVDAILTRRQWDVLRKAGGEPESDQHWADPAWIGKTAEDKQLAAAVQAEQTRIADGEWKPVSDAKEQHGKIEVSELRDLQKSRRLLGLEFAQIDKRITALRKQANGGGAAPDLKDLWSDDLDLTGGRVDVYDKEGKTIAQLKITGRDLERWLLNADVQPEGQAADNKTPADKKPDAPEAVRHDP